MKEKSIKVTVIKLFQQKLQVNNNKTIIVAMIQIIFKLFFIHPEHEPDFLMVVECGSGRYWLV